MFNQLKVKNMKTFRFKTQEDFIAWNEDLGNFVTAVYDGGEFLCDVLQKDVFYLKDIGFLSENACIIPPLTIEQQEIFKDNWGVEIIIQKDLYDLVCKVLTWYENPDEYPFGEDLFNKHIAEEMYSVLVRVQNELFNQ